MAPPLKHRLHTSLPAGRDLKKQITQIILFFLVTGHWSLVTFCYAQSPNYIRVAIIQDAESLSLKVNTTYKIMDLATQKVLSQGRNLKTTVTTYKSGILIGGKYFHTNKLFIKADDNSTITIDGRKFRGDIQLIKKGNLRLLVINSIDLEDYIKGILYHEASHYWPQEALKAQAIACRAYAVYQIEANVSKDFDVTSDIYSQVYGGSISERYRTNKAVEETKGDVLTYQGRAFPAYYHATCSGHTEDASLLWNIDILPLKGVFCRFCRESPHFKWHNVLSKREVQDALVKGGLRIESIKDILIVDRVVSGRITNLKIVTDNKGLNISAKDFRNILGPNIIKSANFTVRIIAEDAVFEGLGWGHGVGMCQWGAYFMAKQGYTSEEILKYYYPGVNLETKRF